MGRRDLRERLSVRSLPSSPERAVECLHNQVRLAVSQFSPRKLKRLFGKLGLSALRFVTKVE
jgi:hypothetical protein